jgi:hypothetical protein
MKHGKRLSDHYSLPEEYVDSTYAYTQLSAANTLIYQPLLPLNVYSVKRVFTNLIL